MRRNLQRLWLTRFGVLNSTYIEELVVLLNIEIMGELVYSSYSENTTESINGSFRFDLVASEIVISNKVLTWLVN